MMSKSLIELLPLCGTIITALFGLWQYKQIRFSDTVISARKEYLREFRYYSTQFCISTEKLLNPSKDVEIDKSNQLVFAYRLKFMLNPFDYVGCWDGEIIRLIDNLLETPNDKRLQQLTALLQSVFILEWKGITKEGVRGFLGKKSKEKLRIEVYDKYVIYCKNKNIYG